jgi:hypothetical protein
MLGNQLVHQKPGFLSLVENLSFDGLHVAPGSALPDEVVTFSGVNIDRPPSSCPVRKETDGHHFNRVDI